MKPSEREGRCKSPEEDCRQGEEGDQANVRILKIEEVKLYE